MSIDSQETFELDFTHRFSNRWSDADLLGELSDTKQRHVSVVVVGAGTIALNKTFPALFKLFYSNLLPSEATFFAFTRQNISNEEFRKKIRPFLGAGNKDEFMKRLFVVHGKHGDVKSFAALNQELLKHEHESCNRLFYFAFPGELFKPTALAIKETCLSKSGWTRIVVEKPLGKDSSSFLGLSRVLDDCVGEENVFRMDHYMGKEMVQSILALRFSNAFLEPMWNRNYVEAVHISLTEDYLVPEGSFANYFDEYGVIRDLILDHVMSLMVLIAMEAPVSRHAEDVRNERTKVLRCIEPATMRNTVLGQFEGYRDINGVDEHSVTPTYATTVLYVHNQRWSGVPFIITAGKGLASKRSEIRVQFKRPGNLIYKDQASRLRRNELVIRVFPDPDIEFSMMAKIPGINSVLGQCTMNMTYGSDHAVTYVPEDYDRLLYDVFRGKRTAFVRADENLAAWRIFEPLIHQLETERVRPLRYSVGSDGPVTAEELFKRCKFENRMNYVVERPQRVTNAIQSLQRQFFINTKGLVEIINNFSKEFRRGLLGEPSTIKMLPAYVQHLPTGQETGVYYALDLGGTNFRVSRFELLPGLGSVRLTDERKFTVPDSAMTAETADGLFDFLANCMVQVSSPDDPPGGRKYGFTFSFPVDQTAIDKGKLITWTKAFKTGGVVGEEVVGLLKKSLEKVNFQADILALLNDTVGTLAAKSYTAPRCYTGLILGTGTNAAYVERVERIVKLPEEVKKRGGDMVINTEWGGFGEGGTRLLPVTEIDAVLDKQSRNPGKQTFEKMISGAYMGEIVRLCLVSLIENRALWIGQNIQNIYKEHAFESRYVSDIEFDMSPRLDVVARIESIYGVENSPLEDRKIIKEVCAMVAERAARLTACGIAATTRQLGERGVGSTIGIDGSVFENHPSFPQRLKLALSAVGCNVTVALSKDGSGIGAALIAAGADIHGPTP